jgi:hypothetical protein
MQSNSLDVNRYGNYGGYTSGRLSAASGDIGLYQNNGTRYGLGLGGGRLGSIDNKINGLGGPKHKRGDIDRECKLSFIDVFANFLPDIAAFVVNRFAGTRLEDLQGDIPSLCKDQHGCRYLQKKLEEGVPEHRDMIFRETFGHLADLMTGSFSRFVPFYVNIVYRDSWQ